LKNFNDKLDFHLAGRVMFYWFYW